MGFKSFSVKCLFLSLCIAPAYANDSGAALVTGGLVLQKIENIEMTSEDLYISADRIDINYVFTNKTDEDIATVVAFPLPPVPLEADSDIAVKAEDLKTGKNDNFVDFKTWVNGKEVWTKAYKEITKADVEYKDQDVVQVTYYWSQTFPAKKAVNIRHIYRPIVGGGVPHPLDIGMQDLLDDIYCPDDGVRSAIERRKKAGYSSVYQTQVGYILTTGGNWAGGTIGDFRLVVDKGRTDSLVSFCGDNVKKIAPTRFEMRAKNYKPKKDLHVLILSEWGNY